MRKLIPANTVDEYLQAFPEPVRTALQNVRMSIKKAAPQAEELISYQIPSYKYKGPLVYFAAFPKHCSLYGVSKKMYEDFKEELKPFEIKGSTIHFTPENPLPASLVEKMVKYRIRDNEERERLRALKKAERKKKN